MKRPADGPHDQGDGRGKRFMGPKDPVYFRLLAPLAACGNAIGKNGMVIKATRAETLARIHVQDPVPGCALRVIESASEDSPGELCPAQVALLRLIDQVLEVQQLRPEVRDSKHMDIQLVFEAKLVGSIMGTKGAIIADIRQRSGAAVTVLPRDTSPPCIAPADSVVKVSGNYPCAMMAVEMISQLMRRRFIEDLAQGIVHSHMLPPQGHEHMGGPPLPLPGRTPPLMAPVLAAGPLHPGPPLRTEYRVLIPEPVAPKLIGHHGENVKALQADTGAAVRVGPPGNLPERLVTCNSTEPVDTFQIASLEGVVGVLGFMIRPGDKSAMFRFVMPKSQASSLLGRKGATVAQIRDRTGCSIVVRQRDDAGYPLAEGDELAIVSGPLPECLLAARMAMLAMRANMIKNQHPSLPIGPIFPPGMVDDIPIPLPPLVHQPPAPPPRGLPQRPQLTGGNFTPLGPSRPMGPGPGPARQPPPPARPSQPAAPARPAPAAPSPAAAAAAAAAQPGAAGAAALASLTPQQLQQLQGLAQQHLAGGTGANPEQSQQLLALGTLLIEAALQQGKPGGAPAAATPAAATAAAPAAAPATGQYQQYNPQQYGAAPANTAAPAAGMQYNYPAASSAPSTDPAYAQYATSGYATTQQYSQATSTAAPATSAAPTSYDYGAYSGYSSAAAGIPATSEAAQAAASASAYQQQQASYQPATSQPAAAQAYSAYGAYYGAQQPAAATTTAQQQPYGAASASTAAPGTYQQQQQQQQQQGQYGQYAQYYAAGSAAAAPAAAAAPGQQTSGYQGGYQAYYQPQR